ncbi:hypothetical protein MAMO4S_03898 [Mesorhizobium amorphae]
MAMTTPSPLVGEGGSARSAETVEGCWKKRGSARINTCFNTTPRPERSHSVQHPSSDLAYGSATFSHKGRRNVRVQSRLTRYDHV